MILSSVPFNYMLLIDSSLKLFYEINEIWKIFAKTILFQVNAVVLVNGVSFYSDVPLKYSKGDILNTELVYFSYSLSKVSVSITFWWFFYENTHTCQRGIIEINTRRKIKDFFMYASESSRYFNEWKQISNGDF